MIALRIVPSTAKLRSERSSRGSGMLATALLGLLLTGREELFFRGYLYARCRYGRAGSACVNVVVFGSLHRCRAGEIGEASCGVFEAGLVFLTLRIVTGSVWIAAIVPWPTTDAVSWSRRAIGITDGG